MSSPDLAKTDFLVPHEQEPNKTTVQHDAVDDKSHGSGSSIVSASNESRSDGPDVLSHVVTNQSIRQNVVKVPRSQRMGLLGSLSLIYEAENPKDYPRKIKWIITFFIALAAVAAPAGSSIIYPALDDISRHFNSTKFRTNLTVALYMLSMAVFPLWWSAFSESAGRRTVYIVSFTCYTIFNIVAAESTSIGMLIAFRFLAGGTAASVQAVGAGTVADIWEVRERGRAMGIFYLGPLCGPLLAPIIGGALTEGFGWRSTQWFQVIYGGIMVIFIIFFLPETHIHPKLVAKAEFEAAEKEGLPTSYPLSQTVSRQSIAQSVKFKSRKWVIVLRRVFIEPLKITGYLRFPPIAMVVYYASIAFGSLYFLNISIQSSFSAAPYDFSEIIVGLLYISNSLGYFVTSILGGRWIDAAMARKAREAGRVDAHGKLIYNPQDRMGANAWIGAILMPVALIWYGWTVDKGVFWFVPILANFFFGVGSMLIFGMAATMLTEFMPKRASNGVALNNFVRNIFSFGGSLLAEPLINAIGNGWLFTILSIITFLSCPIIFAMKRWGEKWRKQMEVEFN